MWAINVNNSKLEEMVDENPADFEGEPISCAKCGDAPEDVLILTCDHNLCISCAAANLRREQQKSKHSFQVLSRYKLNRPLCVIFAEAQQY